jgi:hypothetical protein
MEQGQLHVYKELAEGEHDLRLFSRMNMNEDRPLYLVKMVSGMVIVDSVERTAMGNGIEAIGLNGKIFVAA